LILRKILKIIATNCDILGQNAPNLNSAGVPDPAVGAYCAPLDP